MRPRQYLFALVDGGGNVPPELHAVRRLIEGGHAVTVLADDSVAPEVTSTGAELGRWLRAPNRTNRRPEHDPVRDWECKYPWQLVDRLVDTLLIGAAAAYASDVTEAITRCRPSLVVCSMFCLGGMLAAEAARIPFVVLLPNVYPLPARGLPPFGLGLRPARGRLGRWRDETLNRIIERQWDRKGLTELNTLRRGYRLAPLEHVFDQVRGAHRQLVMTSPALDFPAVPAGWRPIRRPCARGPRLVSRLILDAAERRQSAGPRRDVLNVPGSDRPVAARHRGIECSTGSWHRHDRSRDRRLGAERRAQCDRSRPRTPS